MKNKDFTNLHVHSEYSLLDGANKLKDLAKRASEMGFKNLAITEHGSCDGIIKFNKECKKNNLNSIYGCELYMIEKWKDEKGRWNEQQRNLHLIAHAKNFGGLSQMLRGLGYANLEGWTKRGRAGRPFLPTDYPLKNGWKKDVVIQTGCGSSPFWNLKNGVELLKDYYDVFGKDLYAEVMPLHDLRWQREINQNALEASKYFGIKPIVTNDVHYLCKEDWKTHEVVLAIGQPGITWDHPRRWRFDTHLNYLRDVDDIYQSLRKMGIDRKTAKRAILNTKEVAEKCSFNLDTIPVELPRVLPKGVDETRYMIEEGWKELQRLGKDSQVYQDRYEKEINAMIKGGFVRYMLLVMDLVKWCKANDILVGPGRGSVGGSLVAYALGITGVDPIQFDTLFERFISEGRIDLPDIDLDFEDRKRYLVEKYLREKYGAYNVAHVSTFGKMKGKAAVQDVSRVFDVPMNERKQMSKCIISRPEQDSRASFSILDAIEIFEEAKRFNKKYPEVIKYASKIEEQIKTTGVHAAGLVISKKDLRESGNCYLVKRKGKLVVNWDKKDIEQMGLMKLDVLGLSTLSVISETTDLIRKRQGGERIDVWAIPLDDKKTYREIAEGNTILGFQIGSKGLQKYCKDLRVKDFDTLCAASALWRPGCLKAGITGKYVRLKHGDEEPSYMNKIHKQITKKTYGQIIYQEQIMYMLVNMAGIPWDKTDQVRKTISKSEGQEKWLEYKEMFAKGCEKKGTMSYDRADKMFDNLKFFGQYAFNWSHTVEYGWISYITMWLKTHYPAEFICAFLNYGAVGGKDSTSDEKKLDVILKEAKRLDIKILPPDINKSGFSWTLTKSGKLRAGLREVMKCGESVEKSIAEARLKAPVFKSLEHFVEVIDRRKVNKGVIQMLIRSGSMDSFFDQRTGRLFKMYFNDLYPHLGKKKFQKVLKEFDKTLDEEWDRRQEDVLQESHESVRFQLDTDMFGKYRRLARYLREKLPIHLVKDIDDSQVFEKNKLYMAQATTVKFGYAERAKKLAEKKGGTADALGGIYGNLDDGTGYIMAIYSNVYGDRKEDVQRLKGEPGIFAVTKRHAGKSSVWVNDFVTLKDLSKGKTGFLGNLPLIEDVPKNNFDNFKKEVHACQKCDLYKTCKKPVPPSIGKKKIMILGEAPGRDEDEQNEGYVGDSGRLLFRLLKKNGIRREDCIIANTVACRPPNNKLPNITYATRCPWATKLIDTFKPRFILSTGNVPLYYFRRQPKGITALNGTIEWNNRAEAWVLYSVHPASALYRNGDKSLIRKSVKRFAELVKTFS